MPFIEIKTNKEITKEKELKIKARLGEAISILNKSESWLMIEFKDNCHLYFKGIDTDGIAYIAINLYGAGRREAYNKMTGEVTSLISSELDISPSNIYVSYQEYDNWGWNGSNF